MDEEPLILLTFGCVAAQPFLTDMVYPFPFLSYSSSGGCMERRKKVVVLATGGTIAGEGRPGDATDYIPGLLPISAIASKIKGLDEVA